MMNNYFLNYSSNVPFVSHMAGFGSLILLVVIWELAWKGWALWRAGRNNHLGWFIAILLINSLGILPIIYLYLIAPEKPKK